MQARIVTLLNRVPHDAHPGVQQEVKRREMHMAQMGCLSVSPYLTKDLFKF